MGVEPRLPDGVPQGRARARAREYDLSSIRVFGTAGSPLPRRGLPLRLRAARARRAARSTAAAAPTSAAGSSAARRSSRSTRARSPGACSASRPTRSTRRAEPLVGELGELVITKPMPSMPVELWGDDGRLALPQLVLRHVPGGLAPGRLDHVLGARQLASSRAARTRRSTAAASGSARASSTASSRSCRRSPTASSCTSRTTRAGAGELVLFVVLADGVELDDELRASIARSLRSQLSPRHVPDMIRAVPAIPRTLTGKKLEAPVKRILRGEPVDDGREQGLAARSGRARHVRRDRERSIACLTTTASRSTTSSRSTCTRTSRCRRPGVDALPDELRDAAVEHFRGESARPTAVELAAYYRERKMMAVVFTVDSESFTGQPRVPNEEIAEVGERERRRADPVREHRPAQGEARRRRGAAPDRRPRRARLQVPPERAGLLPERPHGLPALRGDRGGRAAGALPHRPVGRRLRACPAAAASGSSTRTRCTSTTSPSTSRS